MNQERTLRFRHDGTLFEATVTYNDEPFGNIRRNHPVGWSVTLHKPVKINCGGDLRQINNMFSGMLYASPKGRRHYFDGDLLKKRYRAFDPDTLSDREIAEMVRSEKGKRLQSVSG